MDQRWGCNGLGRDAPCLRQTAQCGLAGGFIARMDLQERLARLDQATDLGTGREHHPHGRVNGVALAGAVRRPGQRRRSQRRARSAAAT